MCIMCHLADTPIAHRNKEAWLLYYNTYPMSNGSGVILPYNNGVEFNQYTPSCDPDAFIDNTVYGLPGDIDNTSVWTF